MRNKWIGPMMLILLLAGCKAEDTFETISDVQVEPVMAQLRQVEVDLPEEAAAPAVESESGMLYQCDGYEIMLQTLQGGDLNATIREISGYERQDLTVMYTELPDVDKYALVWACAGEAGERLGKAVVLDDGSYHYVLSILADADRTAEYTEVWNAMFESFRLN